MFSWSIHSTSDPAKLLLVVPMHFVMILVLSLGMLIVLSLTMKAGHGVRNVLICAALLAAFGFLTYSSELELDRTSGTATLREFQYFHWPEHTYSLSNIDRLYVATGSTTSQLRIQFQDGPILPISFLDQNGGKEEGAYAVNQWMRNGR